MKIVISGGGTGGHIYPAITIAESLKKIIPTAEIIFIGTQNGLEKDIVPRYGYPLKFIEVAGFERSLSLDTLRSIGKLFKGLQEAWQLLGEIEPDLVIGTGGYVCGPVLFLAALNGVPTCIQEQNAMPGVTNKILAHFVKRVFLGYEEGAKYFGGRSKKIVTGNPIRQTVMANNKAEAQKTLQLDSKKKTILVSGGSRGARSINQAMVGVLEQLANHNELQIIHVTGAANYDAFIKQLSAATLEAENIKIYPYLHDMPSALAASDLAVFRAGAIGLAELMARGIPSILIPYPYATANHQEYNARAVEKNGAAKVILDKDLTAASLLKAIEALMADERLLKNMQEAALVLGKPLAADIIAQQALDLVSKRTGEL